MSNAEQHPEPSSCVPLPGAPRWPGLEVLEPREVPLGGPRAMPVLRSLPNRPRHLIGAWCFADAFGPVDLRTARGMAVDPHPHTGLQTVSWLVAGEIDHRDSVGSFQRVEPGAVAIMTAGHGISHSEYTPPEHSDVLHGLQLWIALPSSARERAPHFEAIAGLDRATVRADAHWGEEDPTVGLLAPGVARVAVPERADAADATDPDAADPADTADHADPDAATTAPPPELAVTTFIGEFHGLRSDVTVYSPLVGAGLAASGALLARLGLEATFEHGIVALGEGISVDGVPLPVGGIAYLPPETLGVDVRFEAAGDAVLIGGEPFAESFVMFWNFIGPDTDAVSAAREEWQREREAPFEASARPRFGVVDGHDGRTLPSPELPSVQLRPRGRLSTPAPPPEGLLGGRGPRP